MASEIIRKKNREHEKQMKIKEYLRHHFFSAYLISELHCVESRVLPKLISDEKAVRSYYRRKTGKELDLSNPISFAEKLNWYKLNAKLPLMQQCADKYAVREYVASCGYQEILNELYGVYTNVKDIRLNELPERFVLKAAHGSHMNVIFPDADYKWWQIKLLLNSWLKQDIYWSGREWVYKDMPKRIIAEKYLEDETGELRDYKFFCYDGEPKFLQFDAGRLKGIHYRNYYDMDLNILEVTDTATKINPSLVSIDQENFEKKKQIARSLSKPFQFARTDLYFVKGKIYFGELTFFDGGGYSGFTKEEYDFMFGLPWIIRNDPLSSNTGIVNKISGGGGYYKVTIVFFIMPCTPIDESWHNSFEECAA